MVTGKKGGIIVLAFCRQQINETAARTVWQIRQSGLTWGLKCGIRTPLFLSR